MLLKNLARKIVFPTIISLGFEKLFSLFSKKKYLVLAYHGVADKVDLTLNGRHLSAEQFEQHLIYLKKNFNVVTLKEIFNLDFAIEIKKQ